MSVFQQVRYKNIILILSFLSFQLIVFLGILGYYLRTETNCEIVVIPTQDCTIRIVTPIGNTVDFEVLTNDTLYIAKRPLSNVKCIVNNEVNKDWSPSAYVGITRNSYVQYSFDNENSISIKGVVVFLIQLKYHWFWAGLSFLLICLFLWYNFPTMKRYILLVKRKIYKWVINKKQNNIYISSSKDLLNFSKIQYRVLIIIGIVFFLSLFVGIGEECIHQSESGKWRALVALEMKISNNYVVPTLNGETYYNKPPLFNYILLPIVDDEQNLEFKLRAISVLSLVILGLLVFVIAKTQLNKAKSLFATLLFSFSLIVYLSLSLKLTLDIFFSVLIVLLFFLNYEFARRKHYLLLFCIGYFVTALAFLTKGMPAVYFQVISLFSVAVVFKIKRTLFSWQHLLGIGTFVLLVGAYLMLYQSYSNPFLVFKELFIEVTYKLDIDNSRRWSNMLSFFGKSLIAYFPGLLLFPLLLIPQNYYFIIKDRFNSYAFLIFILGCLPFVFGDFYPQYILMLIPFIIILIVKIMPSLMYLSIRERISLLSVIGVGLLLAIILQYIEYWYFALLIFTISIFIVFIPKYVLHIYIVSLVLLIIVRVTLFNPIVSSQYPEKYLGLNNDASRLIQHVGSSKLFLYSDKDMINHATMFYLTYYNGDIISVANEVHSSEVYYLGTNDVLPSNAVVKDSIIQRVSYKHPDPYGEFYIDKYLLLFIIDENK